MKDNREMKTCKEYEYLGTTLNREGTDDQEINKRITKARKIVYLDGILEQEHHKKEKIQYIRSNEYDTV